MFEIEGLKALFESIPEYPSSEEQIERFCLPLFAAAGSDYAVDYVIEHFADKPSMAQLYCSYLEKFIRGRPDISRALADNLRSERIIFDWQRMWLLAALASSEALSDDIVKASQDVALAGVFHDTVRASAILLIAKHGSYSRRKVIIDSYSNLSSPYLQSSLLYSARYFPANDRRNAQTNWSAHSELNRLVAIALAAFTQ